MAVTLTAYAQTTHDNNVILGNNEGDYLGRNFFTETFEPGVTVKKFPNSSNRAPEFSIEGALIGASSITEVAGTVEVWPVHQVNDRLPYSDVENYGSMIPANLSMQLGENLAADRNDICVSIALGQASINGVWSAATKTGGIITYDGLLSGSALSDEIADKVFVALSGMGATKTPLIGRAMICEPTLWYALRQNPKFASADFTTESDNKNLTIKFRAFGVDFITYQSVFGVDNSANSLWPTAGRFDASAYSGVLLNTHSFGLHRTAMPTGVIKDSPDYSGWLFRAREIMGFGPIAVRSPGAIRHGHVFGFQAVTI